MIKIENQKIPQPAKDLPKPVLDCYYKRMNGTVRVVTAFRDGEACNGEIREGGIQGLAARDVEAMKALVSCAAVASWKSMSDAVGDNLLPALFEALWQANLDWESIRKEGDTTRIVAAKEVSSEIQQKALEIESLLNALDDAMAPLAHIGFRHPDRWPDSPLLRNELNCLKARCASFMASREPSCFDEVNAALAGRKTGGEYARALVRLLQDAGALKVDTRGFVAKLANLAGLVHSDTDEASIRSALKAKADR